MTTHVLPAFGVPYAEAGVTDDGKATATCPVCGLVFTERDCPPEPNLDGEPHKQAGHAYAIHFTEAAAQEAAP